MAYADIAAVKVRAGRLSAAWTEASTPGDTDIEMHLEITVAEIDAVLGARGVTPLPTTGLAAASLEGLNADMALVLMIDATWPGQGSTEGVEAIREQAIARRDAAWATLIDGTHPALIYTDSLTGAVSATDFWSEEPDYPSAGEAQTIKPEHAPMFARGQKL